MNLTILFLSLLILTSCSSQIGLPTKQSIYLFKDKDGLYEYNSASEKEKIIFQASNKQVFLDEPYQLSNDTITFGIVGERMFIETSPTESGGEYYHNDYYSVDLISGKNWLSRQDRYKVIGHSTLNIKTIKYEITGDSTIISDTSMVYKSSSSSTNGVVYNNLKPRFYSEQTMDDKSVYSYRGSIYYVEQLDTTLLVQYNGNFDPKFGSGYFQPQIDPTGKYIVFRYLPGFMNFNETASLQKVNIETKKVETLKKGRFTEPIFSSDGNHILFSRNEKKGKLKTWVSEIYLLDLTTLKEQKISQASKAFWVE